jgi:hypothetical protein
MEIVIQKLIIMIIKNNRYNLTNHKTQTKLKINPNVTMNLMVHLQKLEMKMVKMKYMFSIPLTKHLYPKTDSKNCTLL